MQQPKVLVGINYYSGKENQRHSYLQRFLASIKEKTAYLNYDVIVFDDKSPIPFEVDCQVKTADTPGVSWHIVRNRIFRYFLEHEEYDYVFAYDEDFEVVENNWMIHVVGCLENIPEVGILCGHWARLDDGITRQQQHTPTGRLTSKCGSWEVNTNRFATGGCWTLRREAVFLYPEDDSVKWYIEGNPGVDTWYGWEMEKRTGLKLCTVQKDVVMHRGQEFMKGKYTRKYHTDEFQTQKRLY
jgi:hypothetical protein